MSDNLKPFDRIYDKIDKVENKLDMVQDGVYLRLESIDKTLVRQEANLEEHMRRTELLEQEILPIREHVHQLRGVLKFIGILSAIATIVAVLIGIKL